MRLLKENKILANLKESEESVDGLTIKEVTDKLFGGYLDKDVSDVDIDILVAFVYDSSTTPDDEYYRFIDILAKRTKVVKYNANSPYGEVLVCDFSSVFKPYNEELKAVFDMDNSEFVEDEAYYEAVLNLEGLLPGFAGESTYKELSDILEGKTSEPIKEEVEEKNEIINPNDEVYAKELYEVNLWDGSGYSLYDFKVYADYEEQALERVVAYCEKESMSGLIMTTEEVKKFVEDDFSDLLKDYNDDWMDVATEYLDYIYVDATMEGASQPYFVRGENARVKTINKEDLGEAVKTNLKESAYANNKILDAVKDYGIVSVNLDETNCTITFRVPRARKDVPGTTVDPEYDDGYVCATIDFIERVESALRDLGMDVDVFGEGESAKDFGTFTLDYEPKAKGSYKQSVVLPEAVSLDEGTSIPRNARKIKIGDEEYFKDGNNWGKTSEKDLAIPRRYPSRFLRGQGDIEVIETDDNYKPRRTKEYKVLQGRYENRWEDLVSYDTSDEAAMKDLRQNVKDYRENEPNILHRVITRREPLDEAVTTSEPTLATDENKTDAVKKVRDYLNYELQDDDTETGGVAFDGETVADFIGDAGIKDTDELDKLNKALVSCGIKPISEGYDPGYRGNDYWDLSDEYVNGGLSDRELAWELIKMYDSHDAAVKAFREITGGKKMPKMGPDFEDIKEITPEESHQLVMEWNSDRTSIPRGRFISQEGDKYVVIDNRTGDCWVEEFNNKGSAIDYLEDRIEADGSKINESKETDDEQGKIADAIHMEFKKSKDKSEKALKKICDKHNMTVSDFLYVDGYMSFEELIDELKELNESGTATTEDKMCGFIGDLFRNMAEGFKANSESLYDWCEGGDTFRNAGYSEEECQKLDKMLTEINPLVQEINGVLFHYAGEELNESAEGTAITSIVSKEDIDLVDKLDNMIDNEISEEIYNKCMDPETLKKIEEEVWKLMNDSSEPFSKAEYYEGLADEYEAADDHDLKSAEVYNCDLLYMVAIANVLGLPRPEDSGDVLSESAKNVKESVDWDKIERENEEERRKALDWIQDTDSWEEVSEKYWEVNGDHLGKEFYIDNLPDDELADFILTYFDDRF